MKNFYCQLARKAIESFIEKGEIIHPPQNLPKEFFKKRAGAFVSIYKKNNNKKELRGCIGTFLPTQENLAQEIIKNAIAAATQDWRFPPLTKEELKDLIYSVDVLDKLQPIKNINELNPKDYGIIVISEDGRSGLLLPNLEKIDTPQQQISIALQKANISPDENFTILKFKTHRYEEENGVC